MLLQAKYGPCSRCGLPLRLCRCPIYPTDEEIIEAAGRMGREAGQRAAAVEAVQKGEVRT